MAWVRFFLLATWHHLSGSESWRRDMGLFENSEKLPTILEINVVAIDKCKHLGTNTTDEAIPIVPGHAKFAHQGGADVTEK